MKRVLSILLTAVMLLSSLSVLSAVPAFAESNRVGAGETKVMVPEKPTVGDGTQSSPYEVSKPEHFYWIQQNTNSAEKANASTVYSDEKWGPSFGGVYFKQTADLDFAGYVFKESMPSAHDSGAVYKYDEAATSTVDYMHPAGHYTTDTQLYTDSSKPGNHMWGGFAGNYDGQGFAIKNLKISAHGGGTNERWTLGLFGTIYGATLKNMVLDNVDVDVKNHNVSGILVGKSYAPIFNNPTDIALLEDAKKFDFNVIENIYITKDSSITVKGSLTTNDDGSKTTAAKYDTGSYVGSIAGMVNGTTIKNCYNAANLNVGYAAEGVGGIAGIIGHSVLIDGAINYGNIIFSNLEGITKYNGDEKSFGGIVGFISAGVTAHSVKLNNVTYYPLSMAGTGLTIQNCLNAGSISYDISSVDVNADYWGGIVGGAQGLHLLTGENKYVIKNCHNISAPGNAGIQRFAGIIGVIFIGNDAVADTIYVEDCFSVDVAETQKYVSTNEVLACFHRQTKAGLRPITLVGANKYKADGTILPAVSAKVADGTKYGSTKATLALTDKIWVENAEKNGVVQGDKTFQQVVDAIIAETTKNMNIGTDADEAERIEQTTAKAALNCDHTAVQHAAAPAGKGTAAEPYLIDSYEDLVWIAEGIKDGHDDEQYGIWATEGVGASYVGVYFKQTADIDLDGKTLHSIGGYYRDTTLDGDLMKTQGKEYMSAFGGVYDGNGFAIKNGKIASHEDATALSTHWASGLFGAIYGGTVKNVTLSGITYDYDKGLVFGGVVGQARATNGSKNFNTVEKCVVDNSTLAPETNVNSVAGYNWYNGVAVIGGIVGRAIGTTVTGCKTTNTVVINSEDGVVATGGIAGQALAADFGLCANYATINIVDSKTAVTYAGGAEISFAGIVGQVLSDQNAWLDRITEDVLKGGFTVTNCHHSGKIIDTNNVTLDHKVTVIGGIIGGANRPHYSNSGKDYLIKDCYNADDFTKNLTKTTTAGGSTTRGDALRVGGIIGCAYGNGNGAWSSIYVINCYSVDITTCGYKGTNEARYQSNTSAAGEYPVTFTGANLALADGTGNVKYTSTADQNTLATNHADIAAKIAAIDAGTVAEDAPAVISPVAVQKSTDGTKVRLILGVTGLDYKNFGITGSATGGATGAVFGDAKKKAYTSFLADGTTVQASDYGYDYLVFIELIRYKPDIEITYTLKTYATTLNDAQVYGDSVTLTFVNGELTAHSVDTMGKYN